MTASPAPRHLLVSLAPGRLRPVDPDDVFFVEADGGDSRIRLASRQTLRTRRSLGELEEVLAPLGFLRIHRALLVHPGRILEIRRREGGRRWEAVMEPPVNAVLPIAESRWRAVRESFL